MEQIAAEAGVGLVSYTITHHTRQSAVGLPFIEKQTFNGREFSVTAIRRTRGATRWQPRRRTIMMGGDSVPGRD